MSKIVIIGGGSYTWGPTFLRDIFTTPELQGSTVTLHDIAPERMELVFRLGRKMLADFQLDFQLEQTTSLDRALTSADFILMTITTGRLDSMRPDLEIPWKYNIRQAVGDTTGPGGLSRALRSIPVAAKIATKVDEICPEALFLNYSNPLSTLTRTLDMVRATEHRTVGLCHEWHAVREKLAAIFGVEVGLIQPKVAGINHLIWLTGLHVAGRDAWSEMPAIAEKVLVGELEVDPDVESVFVDKAKVKATLFQLYGALPAAGDRHIAEFFSQFITEATDWGADYGLRLTSIEDRTAMELFAKRMIASALADETPLEPFMQECSGEAAVEIITAVKTGTRYHGILNLPNIGQIANLPYNAVVETCGVVDHTGAQALAFEDLSPGVQTILERHIRAQEMTIEAALTGDRDLALQVLLNDPLSSRLSVNDARSMLEELLEANRKYLPQFFAH